MDERFPKECKTNLNVVITMESRIESECPFNEKKV
jgi:hypothetical protein